IDEYFHALFSGIQPVRDAAVMDWEHARLVERMVDYFDRELADARLFERHPQFAVTREGYNAARTREGLLRDSAYDEENVVPFLFKPFDCRWLYWEIRHGLLHRTRLELRPYYNENQVFIVAPQTPRRPGAARPAVTRAVPGFHSVDPDARALPRIAPAHLTGAEGQEELGFAGDVEAEWISNIEPRWIAAATMRGFV